jgi:hypothetical protein
MFIPYGKSFFTGIGFSIDIYALRAKGSKYQLNIKLRKILEPIARRASISIE